MTMKEKKSLSTRIKRAVSSLGVGWFTSCVVTTVGWFGGAFSLVLVNGIDPIVATTATGTILYPLSVGMTFLFTHLWHGRVRTNGIERS